MDGEGTIAATAGEFALGCRELRCPRDVDIRPIGGIGDAERVGDGGGDVGGDDDDAPERGDALL